MGRTHRKESPTGLDHIMSKGLVECTLFRDNSDKDKYLELLNKYKEINNMEIYGYCIMSTHVHLIIKSKSKINLSAFMKSVNQSYASYYNKKYNRIGPVFFDRFKNVPILTNKQTKNVSLYIHRNPKDIPGYKHNAEKYKYSSLAIYIGSKEDTMGLLHPNYIAAILNLFDFNLEKARRIYKIMMHQDNKFIDSDKIKQSETTNQLNISSSDKTEIDNSLSPEEIINFIKESTNECFNIHLKYDRKNIQYTALSVFLIRHFCCLTYKKISQTIGNISPSNICKLCKKGAELLTNKKEYYSIYNSLVKCYS
ncbi:MAG: transposase [Clostridiaceae bacterium]